MTVLPALLAGLAVALLVTGPSPSGRLDRALGPAPTGSAPGGRGAASSRLLRLLPAAGLSVWSVPVAVAVLGLLWSGPAASVAGGACSAVVVRVLRHRARLVELRAERLGAQEACAVLAAELRAGRPAAQALQAAAGVAAGPFRARLQAGAAAVRFGADPAVALAAEGTGPPTRVPHAAAALAACWSVCAGTGSGLAAAVERLERGLRADAEVRRSLEAELAGPRATAGLLAVLPLAGIGLAAGLGARPGHVLLQTTVGGVCLVLGVGLDLLGLAWSRQISRRAGAD